MTEGEGVRGVTAGAASARAFGADSLTYRPVRQDELTACVEIWRESINDYIRHLGQPAILSETGPLLRLYGHLSATDPERFVVAVQRDGDGGERVVAFAAALVRERLWFLSMLFVSPSVQSAGVGRALLAQVMPGPDDGMAMATATDSAQPISNALYSSYGIVPRIPLLNLIGVVERDGASEPLPSGVTPVPFESIAAGPPDGGGHRELAAAVDGLDRELLGAAHPLDHRYLRSESRRGWLYRGPDGAPVGYGYATEAGRVGPVAVRDPALMVPVLSHLTTAVEPRGAFALWLPGTADRAIVWALRSGFRLDQFPVLLCWDRPFADFERYLPISPGLL
jgi:GNAT superfamily N-acetyltransferase